MWFQARRAAGWNSQNGVYLRKITGFSRSIPFFIGTLRFIVFLGDDPSESG